MKGVVVISFLFLLVATLLKPYYPYVDYVLNKKYITENFCENKATPELQCNGKCHLAKQIKTISNEEGSSNPFNSEKLKVKARQVLFFCDKYFTRPTLKRIALQKIESKLPYFYQIDKEIPTPPPKKNLG